MADAGPVPRRRTGSADDELSSLAATQGGAVSRVQVLRCGMTDDQVGRALAGRRWQPSGLPGVYLTFTGPRGYLTSCWAALLYAGDGAVLSHDTAEWLWDLRDDPPTLVHVTVPVTRRVARQPGLRVHYALHVAETRHPRLTPPRTRVEDTVLDQVDRPETSDARVITLVLRCCQRRLTTASRLTAALERRKKIRRRALLVDLLTEVAEGVASALERRYRRDVERAHGLPRGRRNAVEGTPGRRRYRDVRYAGLGAVVELDGRATHPAEERELDDLRDNELVLDEGTRTLRFGWRSVTTSPCRTAAQVAALLRAGGWTGPLRRCGPDCTLCRTAPPRRLP